MDFTFNRQSSKDFLFKKSEALKSSFSSGASGVRSGLFGGLSQVQSKLDKIGSRISTSLDLDDDAGDDDYMEEKQRLLAEQVRQQQERQRIQQALTSNSNGNSSNSSGGGQNQSSPYSQQPAKATKQKPPKPPLPKQLSRGGSIDQNGSATFNDPNHHSRRKIAAPSEQEINFHDSLYQDQDVVATNQAPSEFGSTQSENYHNPFRNEQNVRQDVIADVHQTQDGAAADVIEQPPRVPDLMQRRRTNPFIDVDTFDENQPNCAVVTTTTSQSATAAAVAPSSLGSDLLPGIPRVPSSTNTDLLNPATQTSRSDLLAITPTSGAALPIPGIDPTPAGARRGMEHDANEIYDDSDADSVATEGCDEHVNDDDYNDDICDAELLKSGSAASDLSWSSNDSQLDAKSKECMEFMKNYVMKIFDDR